MRDSISAGGQAILLEQFQRDAHKSENAERLAKCCAKAFEWGYSAAKLDVIEALKALWQEDEL